MPPATEKIPNRLGPMPETGTLGVGAEDGVGVGVAVVCAKANVPVVGVDVGD